MGRIGGEHLGPLLAALVVVGAGQQQPGELAVGSGRRLQADVLEPGDLRQRPLEAPHQLERALRPLRVLCGVQAGVSGQRRDALVDPRVVLHRAGAERVGPGVEVEVAAREAVVVADDLGLGDFGEVGGLGAEEVLRDQLFERWLGDAGGGERCGAAAVDGALVDGDDRFPLLRGRSVGVGWH